MSRALPRPLLLALACSAALSGAAWARKPPPPATVGDLNDAAVQIQPNTAPVGGPDQAMSNYREFLKLENADPKLRAEALRRLGDLNLESGELERMANEVTQLDLRGAEAIKLYSTLLQAYPDYPQNDLVLYQLAQAYETTGQPDQALAVLDQIVAKYPHTRDYAEVQFRRGELLFSNHRYADAQHAYEAVLALGRDGSTFYPQSLYKRGWAQFKQGLNPDSLQSFGDLLDVMLDGLKGPRELEALSRPDRELVDDTLRVMSITFSYLDGAHSVDEFTAGRRTPRYSWLLYQRLGDLYVVKQRYQDAASTDRAFVSRDPIDVHAPILTNAAIEAYRKGGFSDLMLDGKLEYVQRYGFSAPFWAGRDHAAYPQVVEQLKANLKDVAQYYHASAQKSHKDEDYAAAAKWYRDYLSSFPDDADSAATNYLLADALFESRQYGQAALEYEHSAYNYPPGPRSAEAGYAALVSYQKDEQALPAAERAKVHQQAIDSGLKFADAFPTHPESAGVLTRAAQDLYAAGAQPRAAEAAHALLARSIPVDAAKQRIAWTIIGQVSFNQADYASAEGAFAHALVLIGPSDPERNDILERLADTVYKQGESKLKAGDQAGAAEDFLRVARVAPGSKIVPTAQYDAAAALISAQQWPQAIQVLESYRKDYPKGQYIADVGRKLAVAYVAAGRGAQAAQEFARIAANPSEDRAVVHEALGKAADLYAAAGDSAQAAAMLERLVKEYPTPVPDAIEARQRLLDIALKSNDAERTRYWQREIVRADASAGAARTDRTKYLAAHAALALAQPTRDAFREVQLVAPLKRTLAAKRQALEAAVTAYKGVAEYQVADTTTAATYETAELYHTLAHDLLASERPKKLSSEEREQYDSLLEEQAYPFEEQAISIHELNAKRTASGVYDDSVRRSLQALAELKPARYGKSEEATGLIVVLLAPNPPAPSAPATAPAPAPAPVGPPTAAATTDFHHAIELANSGHNVDAELEFKQFALRYPGYPASLIDLAMLQRKDGQLSDSEAALLIATKQDLTNPVAWAELGLTLRQEGKFPEAKAAYEQALAADDHYAPAHRDLGVLLDLYLDQPAAALPEFERYRVLTSADKPITTWIAELRQRTGIKSDAPAAAAPANQDAHGDGASASPPKPGASGATAQAGGPS
jgi:tetratricopeptide (TPR) repeat protein